MDDWDFIPDEDDGWWQSIEDRERDLESEFGDEG